MLHGIGIIRHQLRLLCLGTFEGSRRPGPYSPWPLRPSPCRPTRLQTKRVESNTIPLEPAPGPNIMRVRPLTSTTYLCGFCEEFLKLPSSEIVARLYTWTNDSRS